VVGTSGGARVPRMSGGGGDGTNGRGGVDPASLTEAGIGGGAKWSGGVGGGARIEITGRGKRWLKASYLSCCFSIERCKK
jgi:hypothetical protein